MKIPFLFVLGAAAFNASCDFRDLKIPIDPTYSAISQISIGPKCVRCHVSLATYDGVMALVKPGDPEGSSLYRIVESGEMPRQTARLSSDEIDAISEWIRQGAAND